MLGGKATYSKEKDLGLDVASYWTTNPKRQINHSLKGTAIFLIVFLTVLRLTEALLLCTSDWGYSGTV